MYPWTKCNFQGFQDLVGGPVQDIILPKAEIDLLKSRCIIPKAGSSYFGTWDRKPSTASPQE